MTPGKSIEAKALPVLLQRDLILCSSRRGWPLGEGSGDG